jgi:hypothetical protein
MQEMIEFFEMVSLNEAVLGGGERMAMRQAQLALRVFTRAMNRLRNETAETAISGEASLGMAA